MKRRSSEPIYSTAIGVGRTLFAGLRIQRSATGLENIPATGGAVFAMTHFGYLEFALVEWQTWLHNRRRIRFMATKRAFDKPVVGGLLRGMRHISVDLKAGAAAFGNAVTALRSGELVGVFPEAGVSASFTVRELKSGAARLARDAGVPIIPVAVWGGQRLLTKNRAIPLRQRFGVPVRFVFGRPIVVAATDDIGTVTDSLRTTMQDMVDSLQAAYPIDGTGQWWQPRSLGGTAPTVAEAAEADAQRELRREAERAAEG
ncbi:lysophospholipid acyltransferase family protein [Agreia sp.]|uniref:lysophospholipid acyltransferase family protein n=1 Tax=Agreia sp. TaxID=1872416 RepID=UPI0035BC22D9